MKFGQVNWDYSGSSSEYEWRYDELSEITPDPIVSMNEGWTVNWDYSRSFSEYNEGRTSKLRLLQTL